MTLEEFTEILADLKRIKSTLEDFQIKHGEAIFDFAAEDVSGEEYLYMEVLLDTYCKMTEIGRNIEVFTTPIKSNGTLSKGVNGQICYSGTPLKPMDRLEIYIENEEFGINGWTRVLVGLNDDGQYLIGIPRDANIEGIKARMRDSSEAATASDIKKYSS